MPKSTHSSTRVAHRGPRDTSDPDRRVKYVLRYRRRGDELMAETTVVRRHRRSPDRQVAPRTKQLMDRVARRRRRHATKEQLAGAALEFNTTGNVHTPVL